MDNKLTMCSKKGRVTAAAICVLTFSGVINLSEGFTAPSRAIPTSRLFSSGSTTTSPPPKEDKSTATTSYDPSHDFHEDKTLVELLELQEESQCLDIVRDLNGELLPVEYFREKLQLDTIESYSCPESDAFRGLMSNACRVHLHPGGETCYYKRIVLEELDHARKKLQTDPYKLITDAKSYQVVISFLTSKACQLVREQAQVEIPKCLDGQLHVNQDNPIESKFSFLLEDYSAEKGWYQRWLLDDPKECKATLENYAKIHAFFWNGSDFYKTHPEAAQELSNSVWPSASYVQPKRNLNQCNVLAEKWKQERTKFENELKSMDYWDNLGERLQSRAEENGRMAHPFAEDKPLAESYQKYRTFCHGDPKQANLLFRRNSNINDDDDDIEMGLIDFQWCGFGLAASDIAHHLTSAVHADQLVNGGEEKLLRYYFDKLQHYLVEFGAYKSAEEALENFSYDTFLQQYETGVLDICRLVIAYAWRRYDGPVEKDDKEGCDATLNKTSYNKSIPNVVWLMSRCDEIMKSRGF